jgi:hypothetical protein
MVAVVDGTTVADQSFTWNNGGVNYMMIQAIANETIGDFTVYTNVTPVAPTLSTPMASSGNLILTGTGGTPNRSYTWLSTTNLSPPVNWTTNSTGTLDGTGSFSNIIPINASQPTNFFRLRMP